MNYLPLYLVYSPPHETFSEKLALSGEMLLRGLGTVFVVLALLWGVIELFNFISTSGEKKSVKNKNEKSDTLTPKTETPKEPAPVQNTVIEEKIEIPNEEESPAEENMNDGVLVAAIIAAIEAYRREEGTYALPYKVVSFKRKNSKSSLN